ncbi:oligosaccharide flippase family protein [Aggregatilinea lenta]|uniref:oligosaccharide flippase family protein n=1 Tax=Aggregatilinea lenta TaxID=913108 RepID=UPI000E5BB146|nr:oligosaccharide flippase family protein [Aggregatilinea lenta]
MNRQKTLQLIKKVQFHQFAIDVAFLLGGRTIVLLLSFAGSILLARILGPEKRGIIAAIVVVPGIVLSLADLGVRQATTYFLGKNLYSDQAVISTILYLSGVSFLFGTVVIFLVYIIIGVPQQYGWIITTIPLALLPFRLLVSYGSGVLLAKQQITSLSLAIILPEIVYFSLLLLFGLFGVLEVKSALIIEIVSASVAATYVLRRIKRFGRLRIAYIPKMPQKFIKLGFVYAMALFILGLNYRIDVVILGHLSSAKEVGIYSVGVSIAEMLWLVPAALTTVNFGRSAASSDSLAYARKTAIVLRVTLAVSVFPCIGLYLMAPRLIPFVYGSAFSNSAVVVQAILPGVWMSLIFKVLNSDLAGRGYPQFALWVYGATLVLNVLMNFWLIPLYGAVGSGLASSASYCIGSLTFALVYSRVSHLNMRDLLIPLPSDFKRLLPQKA